MGDSGQQRGHQSKKDITRITRAHFFLQDMATHGTQSAKPGGIVVSVFCFFYSFGDRKKSFWKGSFWHFIRLHYGFMLYYKNTDIWVFYTYKIQYAPVILFNILFHWIACHHNFSEMFGLQTWLNTTCVSLQNTYFFFNLSICDLSGRFTGAGVMLNTEENSYDLHCVRPSVD